MELNPQPAAMVQMRNGVQDLTLSPAFFSSRAPVSPTPTSQSDPFAARDARSTITNPYGRAVGYAYFFNWRGQAYNVDDTSAFPDFHVMVSGSDDSANQAKSSLEFLAEDAHPGATRQTRAGRLYYRATIARAQFIDVGGKPHIDGNALAVSVQASLIRSRTLPSRAHSREGARRSQYVPKPPSPAHVRRGGARRNPWARMDGVMCPPSGTRGQQAYCSISGTVALGPDIAAHLPSAFVPPLWGPDDRHRFHGGLMWMRWGGIVWRICRAAVTG